MITLEQYRNVNVAVFGLGKTGIATAEAFLQGGAIVWILDDNTEKALLESKGLQKKYPNALIHTMPYSQCNWSEINILALSPGVPLLVNIHPVVALAKQNNCRITGDIELMWEVLQVKAKFICVTGTNGKSTTTKLIAHILQQAGYYALALGNIGTPVLSAPDDAEIYVIELSSFQLDLLEKAHFDISIILNITPDHLDRYVDFDAYRQSKSRIFYKQKYCSIINADDHGCEHIRRELLQNAVSNVIQISTKDNPIGNFVISGNKIRIASDNQMITIPENSIFPIAPNKLNIIAAYAACIALTSNDQIMNGVASFVPLEHRMEIVCKYNNIAFINDSKATNIDSAMFAIESLLESGVNIYWIAGGKDKNCKLTDFDVSLLKRITKSFTIGATGLALADFLKQLNVPSVFCEYLHNAVTSSINEALLSGEESVILLSPAFASFDQWQSFEHRGNEFKTIVRQYVYATPHDK